MAKIGDRTDFQAELVIRLGTITSDKLKPTTGAWTGIIDDALDCYTQRRPLQKVHQQAGSATARRFVLDTAITDWLNGTSQILDVASVTEPDTDDEQIETFARDQWEQRRAADGKDLLFLPFATGTQATLRITWQTLHVIDVADPDLTTIPEADSEALYALGIAKAARWVSRAACDLQNESLGSDNLDYLEISEKWKRRADEAEKGAYGRLSADPDSIGSAAASIDWTPMSELARQPRVGH